MSQTETGLATRPGRVLDQGKKLSGKPSRWKAHADRLQREFIVVWYVLRQPGSPWFARVIAGCVAGYVLSPVQLIPSFIPVIGLMDDVAVISVGLALIRLLTPKGVLDNARERAETAMRRGENLRPRAVRRTAVIIASVWLALTVWLFYFLWRR